MYPSLKFVAILLLCLSNSRAKNAISQIVSDKICKTLFTLTAGISASEFPLFTWFLTMEKVDFYAWEWLQCVMNHLGVGLVYKNGLCLGKVFFKMRSSYMEMYYRRFFRRNQLVSSNQLSTIYLKIMEWILLSCSSFHWWWRRGFSKAISGKIGLFLNAGQSTCIMSYTMQRDISFMLGVSSTKYISWAFILWTSNYSLLFHMHRPSSSYLCNNVHS